MGGEEAPPEALLLTRAQACRLLQVSSEILNEWSHEPGFPAIRRSGGHFLRISRRALEAWVEEFARNGGRSLPARDLPPERPRRLREPKQSAPL
jgi:excisionase family DNA binding protein